jgi:hypothetical protein
MKHATLKLFAAMLALAMALTISCSDSDADNPNSNPADNFTFDNITYWVGSGSNRAMLIFQWNDGRNPAALAWGYKWEGKKYGIDMVMDIAKADKRLFALVFYSGPALGYAIAGIGYDISGNNSFKLRNNGGAPQTPVNGIVEASRYDFDDWTCTDNAAHWKAGWYAGYWSYWVSGSISEKWEYSGLGASSRELTNNSIDAWYFDNDMNDEDKSTFHRCMLNGEACNGKEFFGAITPAINNN